MTTNADKPTVVFLMGPTASGKTDLSLMLAESLQTEIISVDSTLVYRGLDIGSAKPTMQERRGIPHHLIDIRDPLDVYSVADFRRDALQKMQHLIGTGKTPLLVGGTMLYFKVLLEGLTDLPQTDTQLRLDIEARAAKDGWPALHQELMAVDPVTANRLHPNHSQRISRALEVYYMTGVALSELHQQAQQDSLLSHYRVVQLALSLQDRQLLHQRIQQRFYRMLENGFEQEVKALFERGDLHRDLPAIRAVGYRQMWEYLSGEQDLETAVEKGIAATRQLAKRQLTWLRSWSDLHHLYCDETLKSAVKDQQRKLTNIRDQALNSIEAGAI